MKYVTQIAVAENKGLVWEYDPSDADNRVLGGKLDVICTIRTLAVKVSISIFVIMITHNHETDSIF